MKKKCGNFDALGELVVGLIEFLLWNHLFISEFLEGDTSILSLSFVVIQVTHKEKP